MPSTLVDGLDPNMTLAEALAESARVRAEKRRETHLECLRRYREKNHDEILQRKREYRESRRSELAQKNREYRARKKSQDGGYPSQDIPQEKNLEVS